MQKIWIQQRKMLVFGVILCLLLALTVLQVALRAYAQQPATVPNTIFSENTPATFTITSAGTNGTLSYTVTDFTNVVVKNGKLSVTGRQTQLTLPVQPMGYYTLNIVDQTAIFAPHQTISFAVLDTPLTNTTRFGVGIHFSAGDERGVSSLVKNLGTGTIRDDISWADVERTQGSYTFNRFDPTLQTLQQYNLDPLLIIDYDNRFYDNGLTPYDDTGLQAFARYAAAVVSHYGPQLKAVEIYNEYNALFSHGPCARKAACYAKLLQYSYQAIKAVRPDVSVVGGAVYAADLPWFKQLFESGGLQYMDVVSDHPYTPLNFLSPERATNKNSMIALRALMKYYNHGVAKPIWITEQGWPTSRLNVNIPERTQAQYLVRSAILLLAGGVERFYWYDMVNDGTNSYASEQNFGLIRKPDAAGRYTPKPAYIAYATLIRQLGEQQYISGGEIADDVHAERFSNLYVLWSAERNHSVTIATSTPITVTTMMGKVQAFTPVAGKVTLTVGQDPLYVSSNGVTSIVG